MPKQILQTPQNIQAFTDFKSQISKMQKSISMVRNTLKSGFSSQKINKASHLAIPPEFQSIYELFKKNDLENNLIEMIFSKTISSVPLVLKSDEKKLHNFFTAIISKLVVVSDECISHSKPIVFMICGQNGSGKTSSTFKLAHKYSKTQKAKTACILLGQNDESHHCKAFEALALANNTYYALAKSPSELRDILQNLNEYDYIFLDTCQLDGNKDIKLLLQYKMQIRYATIQTLLVFSANTKLRDYNEVYKTYKELNINSIIITKLDATCCIGNVISFVYEHKMPIAYMGWGNDYKSFDVANCDFISKCFMDKNSINKNDNNKNNKPKEIWQ
jgi:flagellar biosynthesis protein FlhF